MNSSKMKKIIQKALDILIIIIFFSKFNVMYCYPFKTIPIKKYKLLNNPGLFIKH